MTNYVFNFDSITESLNKALTSIPVYSLQLVMSGLERLEKSNFADYSVLQKGYSYAKGKGLTLYSQAIKYLNANLSLEIKVSFKDKAPVFNIAKFSLNYERLANDKALFDGFASFLISQKEKGKDKDKDKSKAINPNKTFSKLLDEMNLSQVDENGKKRVDVYVDKLVKCFDSVYSDYIQVCYKAEVYGLLGKFKKMLLDYEKKQAEKALKEAKAKRALHEAKVKKQAKEAVKALKVA